MMVIRTTSRIGHSVITIPTNDRIACRSAEKHKNKMRTRTNVRHFNRSKQKDNTIKTKKNGHEREERDEIKLCFFVFFTCRRLDRVAGVSFIDAH